MGRWWIAGLSFFFIGLVTLYVLMDLLGIPIFLGSLLAAEATTIIRYTINDRWVFSQRHPSWTRFWQFHVANAGGLVVWFAAVNILPRLGVHYLLASTAGTGCSVLVSLATNFLWIWRKKTGTAPQESSEAAANAAEAATGG